RSFLRDAEKKHCDLLLDIDVQGAEQIKRQVPSAISIFVLPPDRKTLEQRLRNRSLDREDVIQRRLVTASREIENYSKYDYILGNDRREESVEGLQAILRAERLKRLGFRPSAAETAMLARAEQCRLEKVYERLRPILASFVTAAAPGAR